MAFASLVSDQVVERTGCGPPPLPFAELTAEVGVRPLCAPQYLTRLGALACCLIRRERALRTSLNIRGISRLATLARLLACLPAGSLDLLLVLSSAGSPRPSLGPSPPATKMLAKRFRQLQQPSYRGAVKAMAITMGTNNGVRAAAKSFHRHLMPLLQRTSAGRDAHGVEVGAGRMTLDAHTCPSVEARCM